MSSETLSQNEVDELFDSPADEPDDVPEPDDGEPDVQLYDFRRPSRISREQQRSVEAMYGLVASGIEGWIRARLRGQAQVMLQSVEQITFGEFVLSLQTPCSSFIYDLGNRPQKLVIDVGQDFAFFAVDRLLGGGGSPVLPDRALSRVEQGVVQRVSDRVADDLTDAWEDHVLLRPEFDRFESTPEMIQIVNREDPVLVANLKISFGDRETLIEICLPFTAVEDFFTGSSDSNVQHVPDSQRSREENRRKLEATLRRTRIPLRVTLPRFRLPVEELTDLEEGDILPTSLTPESELEVEVSGQERFRGKPGRDGKHLAVQITDIVAPEGPGESSDVVLRRVSDVP